MTVVDLMHEREQRLADHRKRLLAAATAVSFPAEQVADQHNGKVYLDEEGARHLASLFRLFGVDELDVEEPGNFETVLNTWYVLCGEVGAHVRSLNLFGEALTERLATGWTSEYKNYVYALWAGDAAVIRACAARLGIQGGVPEGAPDISEQALR